MIITDHTALMSFGGVLQKLAELHFNHCGVELTRFMSLREECSLWRPLWMKVVLFQTAFSISTMSLFFVSMFRQLLSEHQIINNITKV